MQPGDVLYEHGVRDAYLPLAVAEGEGDLLTTPDWILAGTGFRTDPAAHRELAEDVDRPVVTLHLVDPRFYHLDTALAVLDEHNVAYFPEAFAPETTILAVTHGGPIRSALAAADGLPFGEARRSINVVGNCAVVRLAVRAGTLERAPGQY